MASEYSGRNLPCAVPPVAFIGEQRTAKNHAWAGEKPSIGARLPDRATFPPWPRWVAILALPERKGSSHKDRRGNTLEAIAPRTIHFGTGFAQHPQEQLQVRTTCVGGREPLAVAGRVLSTPRERNEVHHVKAAFVRPRRVNGCRSRDRALSDIRSSAAPWFWW